MVLGSGGGRNWQNLTIDTSLVTFTWKQTKQKDFSQSQHEAHIFGTRKKYLKLKKVIFILKFLYFPHTLNRHVCRNFKTNHNTFRCFSLLIRIFAPFRKYLVVLPELVACFGLQVKIRQKKVINVKFIYHKNQYIKKNTYDIFKKKLFCFNHHMLQ